MSPGASETSRCIMLASGGPGGDAPDGKPREDEPGRTPEPGPTGPRTPYPVDDPGIADPGLPGSEPDVVPGRPLDPGVRF